MGNSFRVSFRLNPEYDQELIEKIKSYSRRNISKTLRKILREHLQYYNQSNTLFVEKSDITIKENKKKKEKVVKWNFPQK